MNQRPPAPEAGALPDCATPRTLARTRRKSCGSEPSAVPAIRPQIRLNSSLTEVHTSNLPNAVLSLANSSWPRAALESTEKVWPLSSSLPKMKVWRPAFPVSVWEASVLPVTAFRVAQALPGSMNRASPPQMGSTREMPSVALWQVSANDARRAVDSVVLRASAGPELRKPAHAVRSCSRRSYAMLTRRSVLRAALAYC